MKCRCRGLKRMEKKKEGRKSKRISLLIKRGSVRVWKTFFLKD